MSSKYLIALLLVIILGAAGFLVWQYPSLFGMGSDASEVGEVQTGHQSRFGYTIQPPLGATIVDEPASADYSPGTPQIGYSGSTIITADIGRICISPGYACGSKGLDETWTQAEKAITTMDGRTLTMSVYTKGKDALLVMSSLEPIPPAPWEKNAQIQVETKTEYIAILEAILSSLTFNLQ